MNFPGPEKIILDVRKPVSCTHANTHANILLDLGFEEQLGEDVSNGLATLLQIMDYSRDILPNLGFEEQLAEDVSNGSATLLQMRGL